MGINHNGATTKAVLKVFGPSPNTSNMAATYNKISTDVDHRWALGVSAACLTARAAAAAWTIYQARLPALEEIPLEPPARPDGIRVVYDWFVRLFNPEIQQNDPDREQQAHVPQREIATQERDWKDCKIAAGIFVFAAGSILTYRLASRAGWPPILANPLRGLKFANPKRADFGAAGWPKSADFPGSGWELYRKLAPLEPFFEPIEPFVV